MILIATVVNYIFQPKETQLISETAGLLRPQDVAQTILNDSRVNISFSRMMVSEMYILCKLDNTIVYLCDVAFCITVRGHLKEHLCKGSVHRAVGIIVRLGHGVGGIYPPICVGTGIST